MTDSSSINPKYILINWKKYKPPYHLKELDEFLNMLNNNPLFIFMDFNYTYEITEFIDTNLKNNLSLFFPLVGRIHNLTNLEIANNEMIECLNYIKTLENTTLKFYFTPQDVFLCKNNELLFKTLYPLQSNNIKIIVNLTDLSDYNNENIILDSLPFTHNRGKLPEIKNPTEILFCPMNYAYSKAFIKFNPNPINKIALSGCFEKSCNSPYYKRELLHNKLSKYPIFYNRIIGNRNERTPKSIHDSANTFSLKLNKYLANIYTGVFNFNNSIILLKFFEILASGSLLVVPEEYETLCTKLNLKKNVHYKTINIQNNQKMLETIKNILNPKYRKIINKMRKNGQKFCKKNLGVNMLYKNFLNICISETIDSQPSLNYQSNTDCISETIDDQQSLNYQADTDCVCEHTNADIIESLL